MIYKKHKKYLPLTALLILVFFSCVGTKENGAYEFIESYWKHDPSPLTFLFVMLMAAIGRQMSS